MSAAVELGKSPPFFPTTTNQPVNKEKSNAWQRVNTLFSKTLNFNSIKSAIKKSSQLGRKLLKVAVVKIKTFKPKMLKAIAYLGLLQLINIAELLYNYPSMLMNFKKNLSMHDIEGMVLSGLSLIMNPLEALDSLIIFFQSGNSLSMFPVVTAFSVIALPIGITLLGLASAKGLYDLINIGIHKYQMPREVKTMEDVLKLREDLKKKLIVSTAEQTKIADKYNGNSKKIDRKIEVLKTKKVNALKRHTDEKIMNIMTNLLEHLEKEPHNCKKTNQALSDVHTLMNKKITVNAVGLSANIVLLSTIVASISLPVDPLALPIIALVRTVFSLGKEIYMSELYSKGLLLPEMTKSRIDS